MERIKLQSPGTVLFRVDTSVGIGTGHVMRCLALAQAWTDLGGRAVFISAAMTPSVNEYLSREQIQVLQIRSVPGSEEDSSELIRYASEMTAQWVVVDGYVFDHHYQYRLKLGNLRFLDIDDNGDCEHYYADLVLNQNVHAAAAMYDRREPYTKLLLGSQYVLLRREFREWRGWVRCINEKCARVLVLMGGSDPENVTSTVLQGLNRAKSKSLKVHVVLGGANPHLREIEELVANVSYPVSLEQDPPSMADLMISADLAISAGGSTCWEMCFLGLPAIIFPVAKNQERACMRLHELGVAWNLASYATTIPLGLEAAFDQLAVSVPLRKSMSDKAVAVVDGYGVDRVTDLLKGVAERGADV